MTVFSDSIVREVLVSKDNRATGVAFFNRVHKRNGEVSGRCVVVACGCVQSVALLLMSRSRLYPTGLANSSGALGRQFIPHFTGGIECFVKELSGTRVAIDESARGRRPGPPEAGPRFSRFA